MKSYMRPYGVGLLVIGMDQDGPHLYETGPNAELNEYYAYSIGARSQSARTYFENHFESFKNCDLEKLILNTLKALKSSVQEENELNEKSVEIAIVGVDQPFRLLTQEEYTDYLKKLENFKPEDVMGAEWVNWFCLVHNKGAYK